MAQRTVRRQTLAIAAIAAFALSLGAGSTVAMASVSGNPLAMSAVLTSQQNERDHLPLEDGEPFGDGMGLVGSSSRSLGAIATSKYWIVLDTESNVCVVGQFISDGWSTITSHRCSLRTPTMPRRIWHLMASVWGRCPQASNSWNRD